MLISLVPLRRKNSEAAIKSIVAGTESTDANECTRLFQMFLEYFRRDCLIKNVERHRSAPRLNEGKYPLSAAAHPI
jgi:hypothetical protein